jgi:hypothetical protein
MAKTTYSEQLRYWWEREPRENAFMEITHREDIGADLKAPATARGGAGTRQLRPGASRPARWLGDPL